MSQQVAVFTDGASLGNPGPGGWGVVVCADGAETTLAGASLGTTNNRMELMAAIMALESLPTGSDVVLTTDSQYVQRGITEWLASWKLRGWRTASGRPVCNSDLWKRLEVAADRHSVEWQWVRGHNGHRENELADELAKNAAREVQREATSVA